MIQERTTPWMRMQGATVTTPPRERGGFLGHACLSPTTLRPTGFVQASRLRGRVSSASRRVVLPASLPAGLATGQAARALALSSLYRRSACL